MSVRRFAAYFFAIAVGSTVTFASALLGPPPPQEAAAILTPTDQGLDVMPSAGARAPRTHAALTPRTSAPRAAQVALAE